MPRTDGYVQGAPNRRALQIARSKGCRDETIAKSLAFQFDTGSLGKQQLDGLPVTTLGRHMKRSPRVQAVVLSRVAISLVTAKLCSFDRLADIIHHIRGRPSPGRE